MGFSFIFRGSATPSCVQWLCAQGSLLKGARGPYRVLGIEPGLPTYKANALPAVLRIRPCCGEFQRKDFDSQLRILQLPYTFPLLSLPFKWG